MHPVLAAGFYRLDLPFILNILHYLQICISLPTLIISIYFAYKLSSVATINSNLKLVVMLPTLIFAVCATLHSFGNIIPQCFYSIERGNYVGAYVFYSVMTFNNFGFFIFSLKYTGIAIERTVAYKRMATYDEEGNGFGYKLVGWVVLASLLFLTIKTIIIWNTSSEYSTDYKLQRAFIADKSVPSYVFDVWLATVGMIHTIFVLRGIMAKVQGEFSRSLTQSYEMRQTKYTLQWVKRMVRAFMVLLLIALPFILVLNYLFLVCGYNTDTVEIQALLGLLLTMTETYNLACTLFLYDEFPQLKKAVHKDFSCILPKLPANTGTATRNEEAEDHFNHLRSMFEQGNVPNR